ncbi:MAG TPA: MMPL family transporter [Lactobacillaceae bacterium]
MQNLLAKLGRWIYRHTIITLVIGVITIGAAIGIGSHVGSNIHELTFSIKGTPAQKAQDTLKKDFPAFNTDNGNITIVLHAKNKAILQQDKLQRAMQDLAKAIQTQPHVKTVVPASAQTLSKDGKTTYIQVIYDQKAAKISQKSVDQIRAVAKLTRNAGLQTELTGSATITKDSAGSAAEGIGILLAFLVLAVTFASFLAAGLPILVAVFGLLLSTMVVTILSHFTPFSSVAQSLLSMMGLAVGIDYSLFIMSRYRQNISAKMNREDALSHALVTSGNAVVFAGLTVIVALLSMMTLGIGFLSQMGLAAAIAVLVAMLMSLTVTPAILALLGSRVTGEKPNFLLHLISRLRIKGGWGALVTKGKIFWAILSIAALTIIALPVMHINFGIPDNGSQPTTHTERRAYDLQKKAYGEGSQAKLIVLVHTKNAQKVQETRTKIKQQADIAEISQSLPSEKLNDYLISVTPKHEATAASTQQLVKAIRALSEKNGLPEITVAGQTAVNVDVTNMVSKAVPKFIAMILIFAFVLLMVAFRSLLIPLVAVLGFGLSLAAVFGTVVWIMQDGHYMGLFGIAGRSAILMFLPILVIGVLFGLAMDYEVFFVSRVREEYDRGANNLEAVKLAMRESVPAIIAAALIMAGVFIGFMSTTDPILKSIALGLISGILYDAVIVRLILVPATIALFGKANWYLPKWLDKILPKLNLD